MGLARILSLADTHLGFDLPLRPRIQRRRRGPDFFSNFGQALAPALTGNVDCVVHGGDLLYRSKVPPQLVEMAFVLKRIADNGIPVYIASRKNVFPGFQVNCSLLIIPTNRMALLTHAVLGVRNLSSVY